ncbi:hypothetical protein [Pseudomonas savastanoi]|uniref:hypothetical protein n=1 Tax=Pseudomonas savastanoi TaxID=29438 RepID=UPI0016053BF1|nr:hypothetical protein [Pseudomonas savastanoi]
MGHEAQWPRLLALAAQDLGVDLIGAGVEQLDGLILQLPDVAVRTKISLIGVDAFARNQLRGFDSNC